MTGYLGAPKVFTEPATTFVVQVIGSDEFVDQEIRYDDEEKALAKMQAVAAMPSMQEDPWTFQVIRREETVIQRIEPEEKA